ncbi:DNA primase [Mycoplasmopsis maculosa]|uniref:DNA primase n=1 Tax=Mycoplasmopsis maculosa TaxID=114885 RepID=A0A449B3U3_9BACT|nr:DNA primase [Mycoplasmopsis maculosa]VEU75271.1 DNA primase [Mycoplasmopsis maculosa]
MAFIDQKIIQQIIDQNDIVKVISDYIHVQRKGHSYVSICPFHDDTNPSMSIDDRKQIFKCFVCGVGGNLLTFVVKYKKVKLPEALDILAKKAGIDFDLNHYKNDLNKDFESEKNKDFYEILEEANSFFKTQIYKENNPLIKKFINDRKIDFNLCEKFDIGFLNDEEFKKYFSNELSKNQSLLVNSGLMNTYNKLYFSNRITFGIRDRNNKIIGFSARSIDNSNPKYINSPESVLFKKQNILYNIHNALSSNLDTLIITEGFFDVIALFKAKIENVVCLMGTSLSKNHIDQIKKFKKIILFLDGDIPGKNASYKSVRELLSNDLREIYVVENNSGLDPDEIFNKFGESRILKMINEAKPAIYFVYDFLRETHGFYNELNKVSESILEKFANEFYPFLKVFNQNQVNTILERFKNQYNFDLKNAPNPEVFLRKDNFKEFDQNNNNFINADYSFKNNFYSFNYDNVNLDENFNENIFINNKIVKNNNSKQKRDWIDNLFFMMLDYPDLINLFKEKQTVEPIKLLGVDEKEDKKILFNFFTNYKGNKQDIEKIKIQLNKYTNLVSKKLFLEYKTSQELKQDFDEIYDRAYKKDIKNEQEYMLKIKWNNIKNNEELSKRVLDNARLNKLKLEVEDE